MVQKSFIDHIRRNSVWRITRYKSEEDRADGVVYCAAESKELFNAPQISVIRGGFIGAFENLPVLLRKLGNAPMHDIFGSMSHLFGGNILLNEGINELWTIMCTASSGTKFDSTNAYLGVGDSSTAEAASQTGLQAAVNKLYKAMDASYPTYGTSQKATWKSTFTSAEANFGWNEFTVANGNSDSAVNLNRKVSAQGTKVAGQEWELTFEISLS